MYNILYLQYGTILCLQIILLLEVVNIWQKLSHYGNISVTITLQNVYTTIKTIFESLYNNIYKPWIHLRTCGWSVISSAFKKQSKKSSSSLSAIRSKYSAAFVGWSMLNSYRMASKSFCFSTLCWKRCWAIISASSFSDSMQKLPLMYSATTA